MISVGELFPDTLKLLTANNQGVLTKTDEKQHVLHDCSLSFDFVTK